MSSSSSKKVDNSLSSMDVFSKVDKLVSKPVLGSDGAASWQNFQKDFKNQSNNQTLQQQQQYKYRPSVAPKAPLKKADKLGTGFTSWEEERKHEDQVRQREGHVATGSGYTTFKKKNNAEEAAERKRIKRIESRIRPENKLYFIPSPTFQGWKMDYIFTTRSSSSSDSSYSNTTTGYYWDGMDSIKQLRGEPLPSTTSSTTKSSSQEKRKQPSETLQSSTSETATATSAATTIEKSKKKKRKKPSGPVIVSDPNNPMEQVAAIIQQRRNQQLLLGAGTAGVTGVAAGTGGEQQQQLPVGWEMASDPSTGKTYYFNRSSGERSWEPPSITTATTTTATTTTTVAATTATTSQPLKDGDSTTTTTTTNSSPLPNGWSESTDNQTGKTYYYHTDGRTQWDRPTT